MSDQILKLLPSEPIYTCLWFVLLGLIAYVYRLLPAIKVAQPNEWLIIINKGEQRQAGVGLKTYVYPMETAVTYPSVLTKVSFDAMQTTKEMQGVHVFGFAVFSVLRTEDGPFRYYKYVYGAGVEVAADNLKSMAEALMRKHVATAKLSDVLTNRENLRNAVREEMMETTKGWGVWLETFEIKEIKICSKSLFEDMQAEFRQDTHLNAEKTRLSTSKIMAENKAKHDEEISLLEAKTAVSKAQAKSDQLIKTEKIKNDAELEREKAAHEVAVLKSKVEEEELALENSLSTAREEAKHKRLQLAMKLERERQIFLRDASLEDEKAKIAMYDSMGPNAMSRHIIDSTCEVYSKLPLKEIKLNNFIAPSEMQSSNGNVIGSLLPAIAGLSHIQNAQQETRM
jgi:hypothetical protein